MLALLFAAALANGSDDVDLKAARKVKGRAVAAWVYGGATHSTPPEGKRYVAAELELRGVYPGLVLSDIEALNPATKAAYGNPQFACLDASEAWFACSEAGPEPRVRLVWTVSDQAGALKFTLYGHKLAGKVSIDPEGPALPRRGEPAG
ncbi:MAG: hypothetical protein R3F61_17085 [Myxococcota bacterium]